MVSSVFSSPGQAGWHVQFQQASLSVTAGVPFTLEFWARDDSFRDGAFATLRHEAPVKFFREIEFEGFEAGGGHWALTKFDDVHFASRHPEIFSSYPNITIADQQPEVAEYFGSMIALDDPRHARLRGARFALRALGHGV